MSVPDAIGVRGVFLHGYQPFPRHQDVHRAELQHRSSGQANLPTQINEKIKEYFQRNTSLTLLPNNGDLILEGTLTGYDVLPVAPTANDMAGFNRLNVTVQVRFTNTKDETKNFDQSFSFYADFPQSQTLNQNEARLLPTILDQIVQNIFNKSAADW